MKCMNLTEQFEIFVECEFDELKRRDKKGLYTGALQGNIKMSLVLI